MKRIALLIVVLVGCGKGGKEKTVGPEVCPVVGAKAKLCSDAFWAQMDKEPGGGLGRSIYLGTETKACEDMFKIHEANGAGMDACIKVDDCTAWAACVVPAFHPKK